MSSSPRDTGRQPPADSPEKWIPHGEVAIVSGRLLLANFPPARLLLADPAYMPDLLRELGQLTEGSGSLNLRDVAQIIEADVEDSSYPVSELHDEDGNPTAIRVDLTHRNR